MPMIEMVVQRAGQTQHGFKDLEAAAEEIQHELGAAEAKALALKLLEADLAQARCVAVFVLGANAALDQQCLQILGEQARRDPDWRVQEIVAKAFDRYCADVGYDAALPVIETWLKDPSANVRRAVTEGLRIWTGRPYFRENPAVAIALLSQFRNDESEYLRKSVGNALRDISKKHPQLISEAVQSWDLAERGTRQTYKLATRALPSGSQGQARV